jgi:putative transposase
VRADLKPDEVGSSEFVRPPVVLALRKGSQVVFQGCAARVLAICSPTQILLRIDGSDKTAWARAGELTGFRLTVDDFASHPPKAAVLDSNGELNHAERWVQCFVKVGTSGQITVQDQKKIAADMQVSPRTVLRHFERFLVDASPAYQLPSRPGPEKGASKLSCCTDAIILKAIESIYETEERPTVAATTVEARRLAAAAGYKPPSYTAVHARVRASDRWAAARRRHGHVRGDAQMGPAGKGQVVIHPLDFVQMDHAIVDLIVVDSETREEIGRPWITLAIDVATRCIVGFYLTFDDPSQTSVALALEHCCCPKDDWCKEIGYDGDWIPFGLMKVIGWDNAKCFKATSLVKACRHFGIEPRFRHVRHPVHGAYIERFIGTFMGKIHLLKGTTFSNTKDREDYDSQKKAVMSLPELILWVAHQINVYHNTRHSTLGKTPLEAWNSGWTKNGRYEIPPYPADRRHFRLSLLPGILRRVTREGIARFALKYWDDALIPMIKDGKRYWVAHHPGNISRVFLQDGDRFIDIPWRDRTRSPIALFELQQAKKDLKSQHNRAASENAVFEHLAKARAIEKKSESTTRRERRERARRPADVDTPKKIHSPVDYSKASLISLDPLEAFK